MDRDPLRDLAWLSPTVRGTVASEASVSATSMGDDGSQCDCHAQRLIVPLGRTCDCEDTSLGFLYSTKKSCGIPCMRGIVLFGTVLMSCCATRDAPCQTRAGRAQSVTVGDESVVTFPLEQALRILSLAAGEEIVLAADAPSTRVVVDLARFGWRDALEQVARDAGFALEQEEVIRVFVSPDYQGSGPYSGEHLNLNFEAVELRSILPIIGEFAGVKFVGGDQVNTPITIEARDRPWDEALDTILRSRGLGLRRERAWVLRAASGTDRVHMDGG